MKANETSGQTALTREEAIAALQQLAKDLGHNPKKSELPESLRNQIRVIFGKWCYAQAEAGLVVPSEKVLEKRRKRAEHKAKVAEREQHRREQNHKRNQERKNSGSVGINSYHPSDD